MANDIQQIVIQITSAPFVRALTQYGTSILPNSQQEIPYDSLTDEEKAIWDAFVTMLDSKYNPSDAIQLEFASVQKRYEELLAQVGTNYDVNQSNPTPPII